MIKLPASTAQEDLTAARAATFSSAKQKLLPDVPALAMINSWWLDPVYLGRYPEEGVRLYPEIEKLASAEDLKLIHQRLDFCAVNLYFGTRVKAGSNGSVEEVPWPANTPRSNYGWAITPEVLYWGPKFLFERYQRPIAITENGMSRKDERSPDGHVHDPERATFIEEYLRSLRRAQLDGVPVLGYFHWSLLDNWEFNEGFGQRFGLVYVDFKTQKRIVKDSALRYGEIIRSQGSKL